ncbi:hypothetical protein EDB92DRAFT_1814472 [Lactarius akahatsu]|uniref:chitin deacetylase n=1 Tax=Lactarius akahatsu TaxID=416441 RepID=A0AAD4LK48_9AGAM|nr:hypothetical protein EDB92DRAFT_1814472 [Lactarius akahatsu]
MLFNLRALSPLVVFLATSALAQDHSSEQSEAQISDPNLECTPYYYAPSGQFVNTFPPIWQPATLLANDTDGQALWAKIAPSIPTNILPKGQLNGSTINVTYDSVNDPDCWWSIRQCTTPKLAGLSPDVSSVPEPKTMGYGFDDGPNCTHNAFYNFLSSQNQKATMYYIGSNVLDWPLEAQRAVADGHEICALTAFQSQDAFAELWYTIKAIKLVTGVTPTCWRPPYWRRRYRHVLRMQDRIRAIATALGLQTIVWKYDSFDWKAGQGNITATDPSTTVGGIILTHELNNFTMQEAIKWYPQLKAAFSAIVPIGVALNKTQPVQGDQLFPPDVRAMHWFELEPNLELQLGIRKHQVVLGADPRRAWRCAVDGALRHGASRRSHTMMTRMDDIPDEFN